MFITLICYVAIAGPLSHRIMSFADTNNTLEAITLMSTDELGAKSIAYVCILCFNIIFICGGNALIIIIFVRTPALRVGTSATIINLAIADFCIGLYAVFLIALELIPGLLESYVFCRFRIGFAVIIFLVSLTTLTRGFSTFGRCW